ncbi:MAG: FadR family transcriptional regulator [Lachnospiraceae bacterium]|nr:FadR family transcriptional regulator [Lachnospiraceae bacterium]
MQFKKINQLSIKELFISQIEEMILSGELKPGEKLPTEREIADEMNISKTIVHEGIRELSRIGFLDVVSRQGVYVADYTSTGNLDTLFAIIRYRGGMPDWKMIHSLLDVRLYLECPAIEILAKNHTEQDIKQLEERLDQMKQAFSESMETFATALFVYRRTIVVLSGNCISPLVMNAFFTSSISAWIEYSEFIGKEEIYQNLEKTTECIRTGDAKTAKNLFQEHIERFRKHIPVQ